MRKLAILTLGLMLALVSCKDKKEDSSELPQSQLILGDWALEKMRYVEYENGQKVYDDIDRDTLLLTFTSNYYILKEATNDTMDMGFYQITSDSLFMYGDDGGRFKINVLTKEYLEFFLSDEYVEDSTFYREEITAYFDKI